MLPVADATTPLPEILPGIPPEILLRILPKTPQETTQVIVAETISEIWMT